MKLDNILKLRDAIAELLRVTKDDPENMHDMWSEFYEIERYLRERGENK